MSFPRVRFSCLLSLAAAQDVFEPKFLAQPTAAHSDQPTTPDHAHPYLGKAFPENHCEHSVAGWPSFSSMQDLKHDKYWSSYFERVYGEIPSLGYPICPGAFQFIWLDVAASTGVAVAPTNCVEEEETGKNLDDGTFYTGQTPFEPQGVASYIANSNFFGAAVPAGFWVEVFKTVFEGDKGPAWYYMAVGSGVWYNVRYTAVFPDHSDGVRALLGTSCHDGFHGHDEVSENPTECENDFPALFSAATLSGYDSLQFTNHNDCTCGPSGTSSYKQNRLCRTEIVDLTNPNNQETACPGAGIRGGWEAKSECSCQDDVKAPSKLGEVGYSNCGNRHARMKSPEHRRRR